MIPVPHSSKPSMTTSLAFPPTPSALCEHLKPTLDDLSQEASQGSYDSRRLFYGRGGRYDGLEFINIDFFQPVLLITLYRDPGEQWLLSLLEVLEQGGSLDDLDSKGALDTIYVQQRFIKEGPVKMLWRSDNVKHSGAEVEREYCARESGLEYALNLRANRNHGFFLDMASGRDWLRECAAGKRVLNLFSYTCSFSVSALAGGADSVVNIDLSSPSLSVGRKNHIRNGLQSDAVKYLKLDILNSWGRIKRLGPYDVVVVDPPSRQKGSFDAERDYPKIIRRLEEFVVEGGDILACLNAPHLSAAFLEANFSRLCPNAELLGRLPATQGFEEKNSDSGLKLLHYRLCN